MRSLHLFYPENDLALARNLDNYTPPPAASRLRKSGETLALWYGEDGDMVFTQGVNSQWYKSIKERFGLRTKLYDGNPDGLRPAPWGWSRASRTFFRRLGLPEDILPDDSRLARMRELSHRRTAAEIDAALCRELPFAVAQPAEELNSFSEVEEFVVRNGSAVLKLPWSSSGRGLLFASPADMDHLRPTVEGVIRRQGSIMGERRYRRVLDFAMLFTMDAGKCTYDGLSLFNTDNNGAYTGNVLAPQQELHDIISASAGDIDSVAAALPDILENIISTDYDGPLGVDMMAIDDGDARLAPAVELNLRMTMGHVCRIIYQRRIADGAHGVFSVGEPSVVSDTAVIKDQRLAAGTLTLSSPGTPFSFRISLQ